MDWKIGNFHQPFVNNYSSQSYKDFLLANAFTIPLPNFQTSSLVSPVHFLTFTL